MYTLLIVLMNNNILYVTFVKLYFTFMFQWGLLCNKSALFLEYFLYYVLLVRDLLRHFFLLCAWVDLCTFTRCLSPKFCAVFFLIPWTKTDWLIKSLSYSPPLIFTVHHSSSGDEKHTQASAQCNCTFSHGCQPPHHGLSGWLFGLHTVHGYRRRCLRWHHHPLSCKNMLV